MAAMRIRAIATPRGRLFRAVLSVVGMVVVAAGLTGFTAAASPAAAPACSAGTLVHTKDGPVCGLTTAGVTSYLGIHYGAAAVGALRWHAPQPVTPWTATLKATTPGSTCPSPGAPASASEDCLDLNVQVPAGTRPGARLPVFVEIHGGGFLITFTGTLPDGTNLVESGPVVYVAIEYRTGILGFLADKAFGSHAGDYGLQDQQAALRWVRANIRPVRR